MNATFVNASICSTYSWSKVPTTIAMIIQITNFCVGCPLNCYVAKLLCTRAGGLDVSGIFFLSQSVAEIIFSTAAPLSILCYVSADLCFLKPFGFLVGSCMSSRPLFQCCVCVERYLAVIRPVTFRKYISMKYRLWCAVVVWVCALMCGVFYTFYFPAMPHWILGIAYIMILITDVFCCVSILKALRQPMPGGGRVEDTAMNTVKRKAFELVSINLLTFLVQIIPSAVIFGLQIPFVCTFFFDVAVSSSFISNIIPGFVQPLFLLHQYGQLKCKTCS